MTDEQQEQQQVKVKGPGAILKEAREKLGLSAADIANKLHLKVINILALETDEYDTTISMTFTKGYLKLYAKQVNVPEDVVLEALAGQHIQQKEPAKLQSFSKRVAKQANDDRLMMLTYVIVAVLIALIVIWWVQQDSSEVSSTGVSVAKNTVKASDTATLRTAQDDAQGQDTTLEPTPDDLIVSGQNTQQEFVDETVEMIEAESTAQPVIEQEAVSQDADTEGQVIELVFEFSDNCWMNLTDATGEAIAYGVKKSGRVMTVSGVSPFEVTLGAPEVVKISYDGVEVDLSSIEAGQTAKFSLPFTQ
ncbi:RodZ domain-containing protein [Aliiglaciecola sp. LCG003]|uniref:RodZ domain-containing protein n=1 Tax=Aliiglaciecola sp. LCG003 TaxID=3053655 RepID=UPI0025730C62|nr:RodZ domain-containing protein [Aliiglaciecola sp. LCG003]WJG10513.1 DUF4115 domain-containing protein [Aliiglaciecola sp. LCG003]